MSKSKSKVAAGSENEDDPEVYESSGDEWNEEKEQPKKRGGGGRRTSQRATKKQKVVEESEEEEDEEVDDEELEDEEDSDEEFDDDEEDEDDPKGKKNGVGKKKKQNMAKIETTTKTVTNPDGTKKQTTVKVIQSGDYSTGSFVILKKDAQVGDPNKQPCIWRIDGKALLQKYEPYTESGKVKHKNTSIYTGWSPLDKELYAPIMVYVHQHNNQNLVVEVNWDQLKEIVMDSD